MRRVCPLILALALLLPAATAHGSAASVIRDCTLDGRLDKTYSQKELRSALANIPSDVDEYTNCREVIRAAQLAGGSGSGSGVEAPGTTPGGGTTTPDGGTTPGGEDATSSAPGVFGGFDDIPEDPVATATPAEREAIAAAREEVVDADPIALARAPLPGPLIAALIAGGLALLALLALDLRRRVLARRG